jgi:hypothetical protein
MESKQELVPPDLLVTYRYVGAGVIQRDDKGHPTKLWTVLTKQFEEDGSKFTVRWEKLESDWLAAGGQTAGIGWDGKGICPTCKRAADVTDEGSGRSEGAAKALLEGL